MSTMVSFLSGRAYLLACLLANLGAACAIVFANKLVMSVLGFNFAITLTFVHTLVTLFICKFMCSAGAISPKSVPNRALFLLATAFVTSIVLCNMSLRLNTVGFYQITKIAVSPAVLLLEILTNHRFPPFRVTICVGVVCFGVGLATVYDKQVTTNVSGILIGLTSVIASAQYGIWISAVTKQYEVTPVQLLDKYLPFAALLTAICVPVEQCFSQQYNVFTFPYTARCISVICISAFLGSLVTFSTFVVISETSSLTYAVVGHVKTVAILSGGCIVFGDQITPVKMAGISIALCGIIAYTLVKNPKVMNRHHTQDKNDA
jgi:solute carrier family 35, member E3